MEVTKISKKINMIGLKFGRLLVISELPDRDKYSRIVYHCQCDCGKFHNVTGKLLRQGKVKSCGCLHNTLNKLSKHRLYSIIHGIKTRCYNKNHHEFYNYGGRGIKVCDEWLNDFMSFYTWAMNNGYRDNLTIDRIDNNKGYSPDNCRFVDKKTQQQNRRSNRYYTINGESRCLKNWCEILNLNYQTVYRRVTTYCWPIEVALELNKKE